MVHAAAYKRIIKLLESTKGRIVIGGLARANESTNYIPVTAVDDIKLDEVLMEQWVTRFHRLPSLADHRRSEVFGPIFPVLVVDSIEEAVNYIQSR